MDAKIVKEIELQKKIPIIGKEAPSEIFDTFSKLIDQKFKIVEITLRSKQALDVAVILKEKFSTAIIGLGSITSLNILKEASKFDFDFYVSPGINQKILNYTIEKNLNYIPGVSTPSEIMMALEYEKKILKYFHAEKNGGTKFLEIMNEIFEDIKFIPTGGITLENYNTYLELPNVISVGSTKFRFN